MNQDGITIQEACATNSIGTPEDFQRNCNPDGTAKKTPEISTRIQSQPSHSTPEQFNGLSALEFGAIPVVLLLLGLMAWWMVKRRRL